MKHFASFGIAALLVAGSSLAAEKLKLEDLPKPVQETVKAQTRNATLAGLAKEKEDGKTVYEVETKVNGKSRDLMVASDGKVISVEEETDIASIPAPAREAIMKKAAGNKIKMVETLTKGPEVSYEAAIIGKNGKTTEFGVNKDGSPHKE